MESHFDVGNFHSGIDLIQEVLREANGFVQEAKPWELAKVADECESTRHCLDMTLHTAFEVLRVMGIVLQPVIPTISGNLLDALRVDDRNWADAATWRRGEIPLGSKPSALYVRMKM